MKKHIAKYFSLEHYLTAMRRAPKHMKHVYSFIFASTITLMLACIILYADYGFWHDTYDSSEDLTVTSTDIQKEEASKMESPTVTASRFWQEIQSKWISVHEEGANISKSLFESKEVYNREDESTEGSEPVSGQ